jgi:SAM-dependent methyltransferase
MDLDSPDRFEACRAMILGKPSLKAFYEDIYSRYRSVAKSQDLPRGSLVEIGSGAGFAKDFVPEIITTDIINYPGIDQVIDGREMPFESGSVAAFFLVNCLHHIPDAESFFREVDRCLAPGGVALIIDQHHGWISRWVLRYAHHEPYNPNAAEWKFESTGPLSGANGALSWIIFQRDKSLFTQRFPKLHVVSYNPITPLFYWLCGGLNPWTLIPKAAIGLFRCLDVFLLRLHPKLGSFVEIKLKKI